MAILIAFIIDIKRVHEYNRKKNFKRIMFLRNHVPSLYLVVYIYKTMMLMAPLMIGTNTASLVRYQRTCKSETQISLTLNSVSFQYS